MIENRIPSRETKYFERHVSGVALLLLLIKWITTYVSSVKDAIWFNGQDSWM